MSDLEHITYRAPCPACGHEATWASTYNRDNGGLRHEIACPCPPLEENAA